MLRFLFILFLFLGNIGFSQENKQVNSLMDYAISLPPSKMNEAKNIFRQVGENEVNTKVVRADAFAKLGQYYQRTSDLDSAFIVFNKGLEIIQGHDDEVEHKLNFLLASNLISEGKYKKALVLFEGLKKEAGDNNYKTYAAILLSYSRLNFLLEDFKKSITLLEEALVFYEKTNDQDGISSTYNNLGIIYKEIDDYGNAIINHQKSLEISLEKGDSLGIAYSYNNIGLMYTRKGEKEKAYDYYKKALSVNEESPSPNLIINTAFVLPDLGRPKEAIELLQNLHPKHRMGASLVMQQDMTHALSKSYAELGDYERAYLFQKEFYEIKEKILDSEKIKEIERLKKQFDLEQKEREIKTLTEKNELQATTSKQRSIIAFALFIILILFGLFMFLYFKNKDINAQKNKVVIEQRLLRSQMNPHFIFNTLGTIQSSILAGKKEEATSYLSKFAKLLRKILENSRFSEIPFSEELDTLSKYLELQKIRYGDKFDYIISLDKSIKEDLDFNIPPMLFQPFVENSIEHGFVSKNKKGTLILNFKIENEILIATIEDNGVGRKINNKEEPRDKKSLSTTITKERLFYLTQKEDSLSIIDLEENGTPSGTKVMIKFPIA